MKNQSMRHHNVFLLGIPYFGCKTGCYSEHFVNEVKLNQKRIMIVMFITTKLLIQRSYHYYLSLSLLSFPEFKPQTYLDNQIQTLTSNTTKKPHLFQQIIPRCHQQRPFKNSCITLYQHKVTLNKETSPCNLKFFLNPLQKINV